MTNATASDTSRLHQNNPVLRPAWIAPGTARINKLSTISIVAIDNVSDATAVRHLIFIFGIWCRSDHTVRPYPNRNASEIASIILGNAVQPHQVLSSIPRISPIAHPVRQCRVALAAFLHDSITPV